MTTRTADGFDVEVSDHGLGYNAPQKMGDRMWAPMFIMAVMVFPVALIMSFVRASTIADASTPGDIEDAAVRDLVLDYMKLISELTAPLVAIDGPAQVRERIESLLTDVSNSAPLLLRGLDCGPDGLPDPEQMASRALRLPGSRESTIRSALSELLSYVEFELKNHPRIEEPEHFLDAVDGLRAKIERGALLPS